eukprot:5305233-Amphidinium_carterae.2
MIVSKSSSTNLLLFIGHGFEGLALCYDPLDSGKLLRVIIFACNAVWDSETGRAKQFWIQRANMALCSLFMSEPMGTTLD